MDILKRIYHKLLDRTEVGIRRFLYEAIDWSRPLIGIMGQRGVGKTTLMLQRIKLAFPDRDRAFYASLDNLWFGEHNLLELAEKLAEQGVTHLFIDEVHKLPDWQRQVKNLSDSFPELNVVFTGSSLLVMDYSLGDLSRRASMYDLPGLSFREFLMFEGRGVKSKLSLTDVLYNHEVLAADLSEDLDVLKYFRRYISVGYYPFYKKMGREDYYARLSQVVNAIIETDIPAVENRMEYETLLKTKRLVGIVAGTLPYQPKFSTLAGMMSTTRNQLVKLFDLLSRAGVFRQIYARDKSPKSLAQPQKVLLNNSALMYALSNPRIGTVRETAFASMLGAGHTLNVAIAGDFVVDGRYLFEIGGDGKGFSQIRNLPESFVVADDIVTGFENKIPLWLFGFLY